MTSKQNAREWLRIADHVLVIGEVPEPHEPVHVTVIVSGPPKQRARQEAEVETCQS